MLRSKSLPLLLLLASSSAWAETITVPAFGPDESSKAASVTLSGPATLSIGQAGVWRLAGCPAVDLAKPLLDQLGWALGEDRMYVYALAPGRAKTPLDVRLELVIAAGGVTLSPVINYTPDVAGEHRILVDWNHGQDQLVEAIVTVGGGPAPDPTPPGPDPPVPPDPSPSGKWMVMLFASSGTLDNLSSDQRDMLSGRVFRDGLSSKGHKFMGAFDPATGVKETQSCVNGVCTTLRMVTVADNLKPWWEAISGDPMPRVAIAPIDGGTIRDFPLPATIAEFWKLLEAQK